MIPQHKYTQVSWLFTWYRLKNIDSHFLNFSSMVFNVKTGSGTEGPNNTPFIPLRVYLPTKVSQKILHTYMICTYDQETHIPKPYRLLIHCSLNEEASALMSNILRIFTLLLERMQDTEWFCHCSHKTRSDTKQQPPDTWWQERETHNSSCYTWILLPCWPCECEWSTHHS